MPPLSFRRLVAGGILCLAAAVLVYAALLLVLGPPPAAVHIRWAAGVSDNARTVSEQRYRLADGELLEAQTWAYTLTDTSIANVRALVTDPAVADTTEIDRMSFLVSERSRQSRYLSTRHPWTSTGLWLLAAALVTVGLVAIGAAVAERVSPGLLTRAWNIPRAVPLLLIVLLALEVASMQHLTLTYDEPEHLKYGQNILQRLDSSRLDDSGMPISVVNAVPGFVALHMPRGAVSSFLAQPETGRYGTIFFSVLVALCVFAWARDLYGVNAGLLVLALYVFDPNLLAHSQLMTTDVFVAGAIAFTLYWFWKLLADGSRTHVVVTGLMLGVAQSSKYTALVLFPLLAVIALTFHGRELLSDLRERRLDAIGRRAMECARISVALVALAAVVINVAFLFNGTFTPLNRYSFESIPFRAVQSSAGVLGELPLPLPFPYLQGLDLVTAHERTGAVFGRIYLFGDLREGQGFPGYYFYAFLYKVPIASQLLLLTACAVYVARRRSFDFLKNEAVMFVPIVFFAIYFNFFYRAQIGIRHFLVVFPLLYVCAGAVLAHSGALTLRSRAAVGVAVGAAIVSVLSYYPHFLPYFNEFLRDRTRAYTVLADSNIDWGQSEWYVRRYVAAHPGAVVDPVSPTTGTVLVHVNALTGVVDDPDRFRWLREHFTPVDHIAYAVLVYRISPADLEHASIR